MERRRKEHGGPGGAGPHGDWGGVVAAPGGASALAPDPIAVPIEVLGVRGEDLEVPVGDLGAVQVRWRGRDADGRVRRVAGPESCGLCSQKVRPQGLREPRRGIEHPLDAAIVEHVDALQGVDEVRAQARVLQLPEMIEHRNAVPGLQ